MLQQHGSPLNPCLEFPCRVPGSWEGEALGTRPGAGGTLQRPSVLATCPDRLAACWHCPGDGAAITLGGTVLPDPLRDRVEQPPVQPLPRAPGSAERTETPRGTSEEGARSPRDVRAGAGTGGPDLPGRHAPGLLEGWLASASLLPLAKMEQLAAVSTSGPSVHPFGARPQEARMLLAPGARAASVLTSTALPRGERGRPRTSDSRTPLTRARLPPSHPWQPPKVLPSARLPSSTGPSSRPPPHASAPAALSQCLHVSGE